MTEGVGREPDATGKTWLDFLPGNATLQLVQQCQRRTKEAYLAFLQQRCAEQSKASRGFASEGLVLFSDRAARRADKLRTAIQRLADLPHHEVIESIHRRRMSLWCRMCGKAVWSLQAKEVTQPLGAGAPGWRELLDEQFNTTDWGRQALQQLQQLDNMQRRDFWRRIYAGRVRRIGLQPRRAGPGVSCTKD